jgi:DNA-binding MarR family transcriptional regulator
MQLIFSLSELTILTIMTVRPSPTVRRPRGTSGAKTSEIDTAVALRVAVTRIHRALRTRPDWPITPSQASALSRIEQVGPVRLGVLSGLENIAPATMSKVVDCLEDLQLITRIPDELDGRASLVQISDSGSAMLYNLRTVSTLAIHDALTVLSSAERAQIRRVLPVLEKLAERLQDHET